MKNLLSLILTISFAFTGAFAQVGTIGVIGTGSPNGNWDDDVDLLQSTMDTSMWVGTRNVIPLVPALRRRTRSGTGFLGAGHRSIRIYVPTPERWNEII